MDPASVRGDATHHRTERDDGGRAQLSLGDERAVVNRDDRALGRRSDVVGAVDHVRSREERRERGPPRPHDFTASPAGSSSRFTSAGMSLDSARRLMTYGSRSMSSRRSRAGSSASTNRPTPVRGPTSGVASMATRTTCDATGSISQGYREARRSPGSLEPLMSDDPALLEVVPRRRVGEHFRDIWRYRELLSASSATS